MLKEKKMNKEKLDNGLLIKVYKLTNNKNGLEYRIIVREKRFGKIIHDKMFFTKDAVNNFIAILKDLFITRMYIPFNVNHIELMLKIKNAKDNKERDMLLETIYPVYTGGCEGLRIKHKTNGLRVINYDFLDKIRYDKKEAPEFKNMLDDECFKQEKLFDEYLDEYGITEDKLIKMIKNGFDNINYKDIDNVIVRFKHKLYRH